MSSLRDYYQPTDAGSSSPVLSVEFWPPKTEAGEQSLFAEIERINSVRPAYCSMTYGAGGSTRDKTVELVVRIQREFGLDMMCHLTVVDQSRAEVCGVLDRLRDEGVFNLIALGGDPAPGSEWSAHADGFAYAGELVVEARRRDERFALAVAGFPEVHPRAANREDDLRFLKGKVDAGASVVITQLFFDNDDYYRFVDDARAIGIGVPIVPGILPIRSGSQIRRFAKMCGAGIPPKLDALLNTAGDDDAAVRRLGVDYATDQCEQLLKFGVPGFHFYSLNKADALLEIYRRLGLE
ncbi:MAG TPA: methylenetetrahydrofolate reductase [NAD(P)H] [Pseudonocardia sp.]|jgi:methylenetetrahydrofolate reductase (NADPH)